MQSGGYDAISVEMLLSHDNFLVGYLKFRAVNFRRALYFSC